VPQQGRARLAIQTALAGGRLAAPAVVTTLMLLLAFPLVYLVIIAASRYWERCEIGINANYPTDCASPGLLDPLVKLRG
jgi:hypothetical protein